MKIYLFSSAKVLLLFEIRKFLHKKNAKFLIFYAKSRISCLLCTKKSLSEERLSFAMRLGLVAVLLVVLLTADVPVPCLHGLDTAGRVLLCEEGCLVGCDLHQVFAARTYGCCDFREARASCELFRLRHRRTLYLAADIDAVTGVARGGRYAVRAQEHFLTVVMTGFGRFGECSGYAVDTGTPVNFSHSRSAIGSQRSIPLR